jgi:gentisate 1,2-dioxygenase
VALGPALGEALGNITGRRTKHRLGDSLRVPYWHTPRITQAAHENAMLITSNFFVDGIKVG